MSLLTPQTIKVVINYVIIIIICSRVRSTVRGRPLLRANVRRGPRLALVLKVPKRTLGGTLALALTSLGADLAVVLDRWVLGAKAI